MGDDEHSSDSRYSDELPDELDVTGYVGQYTFPDIIRRRIPAVIYVGIAGACFLLWVTHQGPGHVLVNDGFLWVAVFLAAAGVYHWLAAWPLNVRETDALVAASLRVGFPIGHASAQLGWNGLRDQGSACPAGVYFLDARIDTERMTGRIVKLS